MNCPKHHLKMQFEFRIGKSRYFSCASCAMLWVMRDSGRKSETNVSKNERNPLIVPHGFIPITDDKLLGDRT